MTLPAEIEISPHVISREVGGETVILDIDKGTRFGLDAVGVRIWQLIGEGLAPAAVCDRIFDEFEVSRETAEAHLARLAAELEEEGLVHVRS